MASLPLTPATTGLKLSKVPIAVWRTAALGRIWIDIIEMLEIGGYLTSPNSDSPFRHSVSPSAAGPRRQRNQENGSGDQDSASAIAHQVTWRSIRPSIIPSGPAGSAPRRPGGSTHIPCLGIAALPCRQASKGRHCGALTGRSNGGRAETCAARTGRRRLAALLLGGRQRFRIIRKRVEIGDHVGALVFARQAGEASSWCRERSPAAWSEIYSGHRSSNAALGLHRVGIS